MKIGKLSKQAVWLMLWPIMAVIPYSKWNKTSDEVKTEERIRFAVWAVLCLALIMAGMLSCAGAKTYTKSDTFPGLAEGSEDGELVLESIVLFRYTDDILHTNVQVVEIRAVRLGAIGVHFLTRDNEWVFWDGPYRLNYRVRQ